MTEGFVLGEPIFDEQGKAVDVRLLEVNNGFYQQTGILKDVLGRPLREYLPGLEQLWIDRYADVARTGQAERFESYNADTRRHYDVYAFCPTPGGFAALFQDVTVRKQTEKALLEIEQRYTALFNNRTNAIAHLRIVTDEQGKPLDYYTEEVNAAYERITGIKKEEIVGKLITEVFPNFRHLGFDFIGEFGAIALKGGEGEFEMYFPPTRQWFSLYAYSPKHGECTAIFTDITGRKDAEAEIQRLNADLERRVHDRTAELEQANEALLHANMELQHFAHAAAHDLQTPLRSIVGFAQLLQQAVRGCGGEQVDELSSQVTSNAKRLQTLIQELLAYTRLDIQRRPFEAVDLRVLLDEVIESLAILIEENGAEVSCGHLPTVTVDRIQIAQVFQNLIENGIKYNRSKPPRLSIDCERLKDKWVLTVVDNGIGIDPKQHERIFDIFKRLHTYHQVPGTGIGLALCRRIVERHGGHIWVESAPGMGSTFYFSLGA
jgi:PAS domain-containing protein/two-component sensor histidine kinase